MSADPNIKSFTLVGGKSELDALSTGTGGKRGGSRKRQSGGTDSGPSNVPPGPSYQMTAANSAAARASAPQVMPQAPLQAPAPAQQQQLGGYQKNVKVVLTPKKKTNKVVLDAPKKKKVPITLATTQSKTRKVAKKIKMNISNMSKRMTRAKEIRKESKTLDIEKIKAALKSSGLIKESTKAPDAILRSMYTDFHLLKNKAL
jgi:hypothetical protein